MKKAKNIPDCVPIQGPVVEHAIWTACLVAGLMLLIIHNWAIAPWMLDDAFISFRYSEHFAAGNGLVFNLGERVEGYTTFLWVFLLGIGNWLSLETSTLAKILGWVATLGTCYLTAFSFRWCTAISKSDAGIAMLLLCSCGVFSPWPSSGMEVSLFALLVVASLISYGQDEPEKRSSRYWLTGVVTTLLVMTRPEGILLVGVLLFHAGYRFVFAKERQSLWFPSVFVILYGAFFFWRYQYYGYLLPNTFYAKVGNSGEQLVRGLEYVGRSGYVLWPLVLLAILGAILFRRTTLWIRLVFAYLIVHTGYVVFVGGDCMPAYRFMTPLLPMLAILAAVGLNRFKKTAVRLTILLAMVCFNVYQMFFAFEITGHIKADKVAVRGKEVGLWLKEHLPPGTLIATNTAGTIPYYSGLPVVDMLGLNDTTIAHRPIADMGSGLAGHEKGDGKYVLGRRPALIQFHSSLGRLEPSFRSDRELYEMQEFRLKYRPVAVWIPKLQERAIFYVRNDIPLTETEP